MTRVSFPATARRDTWFAGEPVVFDLTVDNGEAAPVSFPNPMLAGSATPTWTLTAPDGTSARFSREDARRPTSLVRLQPGERWVGELVLAADRVTALGAWTLAGELVVDGHNVAVPPVTFTVVEARWAGLVTALALGDDGEVGREALLPRRDAGASSLFASVLREANPRLGEGAAGAPVPRGPLPLAFAALLPVFSNETASLRPLRWRVTASDAGVTAGTNLHPATVALPAPSPPRSCVALAGPRGALRVVATVYDPSPALVLLGADAPADVPSPRAPRALGPLVAAPTALAATLGPEGGGSPVLVAAVSSDAYAPAALAMSLRADDPSATLLSLPPLSGTRVELVQATLDGVVTARAVHLVLAVQPSSLAAVWAMRGGGARCVFLARDPMADGGLSLVELRWDGAIDAEPAVTMTPLPAARAEVRRAWLVAWERRGVFDRFVCLQRRDGSTVVAMGGSPPRAGRMPVAPNAPAGFVPGVDRWYVVQVSEGGDVTVDPI